MQSIFLGREIQDALRHRPPGITSVRDALDWARGHLNLSDIDKFLIWARDNADKPQYFDRTFERFGDLGITARKVWIEYAEALKRGDEDAQREILRNFITEEDSLFKAIDSVFQKQLEDARYFGPICVIEFGQGVGRFTARWMRKVLDMGGEYFTYDSSDEAVRRTKSRLRVEGLGDEIWRIRKGSTRELRSIIKNIDLPHYQFILPVIRLGLHIVLDPLWRQFYRQLGELAFRVLNAETAADYLTPGRPQHKGTKFRHIDEITKTSGMVLLSQPRTCPHHGDLIAVLDYGQRRYYNR